MDNKSCRNCKHLTMYTTHYGHCKKGLGTVDVDYKCDRWKLRQSRIDLLRAKWHYGK